MTAPLRLLHGDCIEQMRELDEASVDAVVCDPPYGLEFMGKEWDRLAVGNRMAPKLVMKADEPEKGNPWASERKSYGTPKRNPRCRNCGKQKHNHPKSRCVCDVPSWDLEGWHHNYRMQEWHEAWATEALRVLKPGGHLLAFGGTRTYHRLACAIEDAGFEIRDSLIWIYGSGFPKSLDVSKAIDKAAGAEREVVGYEDRRGAFDGAERDSEGHSNEYGSITNKGSVQRTAAKHLPACGTVQAWPLEDGSGEWEVVDISGEGDTLYIGTREECEAQAVGCDPNCSVPWQGWGTALKPAHEPIVVARKPLSGTVAGNVLEHGTGALNIDGCRIDANGDNLGGGAEKRVAIEGKHEGWSRPWMHDEDAVDAHAERVRANVEKAESLGRWPANVTLSPEAAEELDRQSGESVSRRGEPRSGTNGEGWGMTATGAEYDDRGGCSRFFYVAKASRAERNAGLDGFEERGVRTYEGGPIVSADHPGVADGGRATTRNVHPTVKPIDLMRWLVRLVTPPGGTVLDPFLGSGTTGAAAVLEGFDFIGIEREAEYHAIAEARIKFWAKYPGAETDAVLRSESHDLEAQGQGSLLGEAA